MQNSFELRESKFPQNNVVAQHQNNQQGSQGDKEFQNENPTKSFTKLPPLKKTKTDEPNSDKINEVPPPTILERRPTDPGDKKSLNNTQNTYVIKKFNSKLRISKKKGYQEDCKPELIAKYNNYVNLLQYINISNNLKVVNSQHEGLYTLHVGKGNNGNLIRNIFRNWRPWWTIEENDPQNSSINLHWYQLRQNSILQNFKTVNNYEEKYEYYLEEAIDNETVDEKKEVSVRSNSKISNGERSSVRSHSLIQKEHSALSRTMFSKKVNSKIRSGNKSSQKTSRLSPMMQKHNMKELKEDVAQGYTTKKVLTNPKMWPIYSMYRRIFSAQDMRKLKKLNIFRQNGKINGKLSRIKMRVIQDRSKNITMHNHLENNWNLSNKKALFMNMKNYYDANKTNPFDYIPMTFHVQKIGDNQYDSFIEEYHRRTEQIVYDQKNSKKPQYKSAFRPKKRNAWLIKPGENSNRGIGIQVAESLEEIKQKISKDNFDHLGRPRTHIIQEYILPFLYQKRKFDIRSYILITSVNGHQKGYWYQDGYIRTASKQFNMKNLANKMIHLTNDAVQKKGEDYGKYQPANKISFSDFQRYLDSNYNNNQNGPKYKFWQQAYPEMKKLATDAIRAVYTKINSSKKEFSFQIFGLDFLIDENFKIWLIQANTNPCLELSSPLLGRLIPAMLENSFKIAIDPIFPPPPLSDISKICKKIVLPQNSIENNKFQLVFDQQEDGEQLKALLTNAPEVKIYDIEEEQDEFYDDDFDTKEIKDNRQSGNENTVQNIEDL